MSPRQLLVTLAVFILSASIAFPSHAAKPKKLLLKVQLGYSTSLPALGTSIVWVKEQLEVVSDRRIRLKLYEPGKLVSPFEILDAVSTGKLNAGYATAGYWAGKIPAAPLFSSVPFGPEAGEYMAWLYHRGGLALYQEMYDQAGYHVHPIPCAIIAPETSGWFAKPIDSPEDLKGLRMRFFGLGGKVMSKLGVSTSMMSGGSSRPWKSTSSTPLNSHNQPSTNAWVSTRWSNTTTTRAGTSRRPCWSC
jgi:TRAP-type mannitol/chloroaromatic compound transport system substrate-binding protein